MREELPSLDEYYDVSSLSGVLLFGFYYMIFVVRCSLPPLPLPTLTYRLNDLLPEILLSLQKL